MAKYRNGLKDDVDVPEALGDPNDAFFDEIGSAANCYAYAVNVFRSEQPSINPGELGVKGTKVAAFAHDEATYKIACEADGLIFVGGNSSAYDHQTGGYLVAFFKSMMDMHWRRRDSAGMWTEKLPTGSPYVCEAQDQAAVVIKGMRFIAYYWVRPDVVKLRVKEKKGKGCLIM